NVVVSGGRIAAVEGPGKRPGKGEEGRGKHLAVQVRDCTGCLVMPGLIQAHIHLCQTLFRGLADELRLEQWLSRRIWPLEAAHAAETIVERETVLRTTGMEEIAYLDSVGISGKRAALAHCVWVDQHETVRLARQGTNVVHCPSSNLMLGSGVARVPELLEAGCRVAIGADGAACNNRLEVFAEMRLAALIQKPRL